MLALAPSDSEAVALALVVLLALAVEEGEGWGADEVGGGGRMLRRRATVGERGPARGQGTEERTRSELALSYGKVVRAWG
jgi:hypothetical protein